MHVDKYKHRLLHSREAGGARRKFAPAAVSRGGLVDLAGRGVTSRVAGLLVGGEILATGTAGGGVGTRAVLRGPMLRRFCGFLVTAPFVPALDGKAPLMPAPLLELLPLTDRSCEHVIV